MRQKVLVIDEERDYREGLATQLQNEGYDVIQAESGSDGLLKALYEVPHLIVLNLDLFGINGIQAIVWLKEAARTKDIPVIAYTCSEEENRRQKALQVGAATVLTKPGSRVILRMLVQRLLQPEERYLQHSPFLGIGTAEKNDSITS
jgi:DNA-binding response OmpR family regulator